jgi:hypothetical protein
MTSKAPAAAICRGAVQAVLSRCWCWWAAATPRTTSPTTTTAGLPRPHWRQVGQQIAQAGDALALRRQAGALDHRHRVSAGRAVSSPAWMRAALLMPM